MDWNAAIEKHCDALKRILATLVAMAGFASHGQFAFVTGQGAQRRSDTVADNGKPSPTLPRHLHRAVLRLLRPAEAAARRLIIALARSIVLPPPRPSDPRKGEGNLVATLANPLPFPGVRRTVWG